MHVMESSAEKKPIKRKNSKNKREKSSFCMHEVI